MVNNLDYHLSFKISLKDKFFHISINSLGLYLSPEYLLNFISNFYIPPCVGKFSKFMVKVHIPRKFIDRGIFIHAPSHSKLTPKFLLSRPRQKEITHSPRQHSFENLFPPTVEMGGGNYDLLYNNSVRKDEDDLDD